jgi:hypothetical protein
VFLVQYLGGHVDFAGHVVALIKEVFWKHFSIVCRQRFFHWRFLFAYLDVKGSLLDSYLISSNGRNVAGRLLRSVSKTLP